MLPLRYGKGVYVKGPFFTLHFAIMTSSFNFECKASGSNTDLHQLSQLASPTQIADFTIIQAKFESS
jgi:hypothetical protein